METGRREMIAKLKRGFNPRNVAVVGAARHNNFSYIRSHLPFHQSHGKLFHVNIAKDEWPGAEALGVQAFSSLLDIPEPVDYVTISVPRQAVPRVLEDCIKKGVAVAHVYSAGFAESGEEEGIRLEHVISEMAQKSGLALVGPNCMGLFNPAIGIGQGTGQYHGESGYLGYISQSGSQSSGIAQEAYAHGIKVSKGISMGNGLIVDTHDLIDYLAEDEETKVIGIYMEGLRNPYRFFQSLRDACKRKPVLLWKVGQTEDAARASTAHSGGTSYLRQDLWNSLVLRCGAIPVDSLEEMIDTTKAIATLRPAIGVNVGLYAVSGGHSTDMANVFSNHGFKVAPLTERSYQVLRTFVNLIGGNYVNPIQTFDYGEQVYKVLDVLCEDENLDVVVVEVSAGRINQGQEFFDSRVPALKHFQEHSTKPVVTIITPSFPRVDSSVLESVDKRLRQEGILTFRGFERGAKVLKSVVDYHAMKAFLGE